MPPDDLCPHGVPRDAVFYTRRNSRDPATKILRGSHVQATYRTLIGLLAATGMRIGEAIGLDRNDFDAQTGW